MVAYSIPPQSFKHRILRTRIRYQLKCTHQICRNRCKICKHHPDISAQPDRLPFFIQLWYLFDLNFSKPEILIKGTSILLLTQFPYKLNQIIYYEALLICKMLWYGFRNLPRHITIHSIKTISLPISGGNGLNKPEDFNNTSTL